MRDTKLEVDHACREFHSVIGELKIHLEMIIMKTEKQLMPYKNDFYSCLPYWVLLDNLLILAL